MILILGNLYITNKYKKKLTELDNDIIHIQEKFSGIDKIISKANCICACNFNLNNYIDYLNPQQCIVMAETGVVNIDLKKAKEKNLNIFNIENYSCDAVVQYIMYCIIKDLRQWDLCFHKNINRENIMSSNSYGMDTLKVGIVGYGTIGKSVAKILKEFNCKVLATGRREIKSKEVENVSINKLFKKSDIVIVCCNQTNTSSQMINNKLLQLLKHRSILISISQISIFNKDDLGNFLRKRLDVKAYLDFDTSEFVFDINKLPNVNVSPHVAFFTQQTILNRTEACIQKIQNHIELCKNAKKKSVGVDSLELSLKGMYIL